MKNDPDDAVFLSELVLLRNDPELVREVLPLARSGNRNAQYALGLIYAEGRGVEADVIQAYVWLTRAIEQGDEDAFLLRDMLMNNMSEQEVALAQRELSDSPLQ